MGLLVTLHSKDRQEKWPRLLAHLAAEHGRDFGLLARVTAVGRVSAGQQVRIVTT